jgi:predicted RNA-binding protein YlxR (DUF448 family)
VTPSPTHTKPTERAGARRTCVGCGQTDAPESLVRVVLGPQGEVAVDLAGGAFGRGAHVHAAVPCLEKACKAGLSRSFKCRVEASADDLAAEIARAAERRIEGLLVGARRAGHLAVGADRATEALDAGASLAVVAADAGSIARKEPFARAVAQGHAVVFRDKAQLGALLAQGEVAVLAVMHEGIAEQIRRAKLWAESVGVQVRTPTFARGALVRSEACRSREDR